jgi:protein arginine kinase activator
MICESCKEKEATVHLTQVIDGAIKKLHLCEECAAKSGFDVHGPISITDILLGMGVQKGEQGSSASDTIEWSCPRCHMRRTDFKKTGRFGCSTCYEAFAEGLTPMLKAMHRNDQHVGKVPASQEGRIKANAELTSLQKKLEQAIAKENFEEAAKLRDSIQAYRAKLAAEESTSMSKSKGGE